ncbi:MAG: CCA tRNA nucleotidyltransferase [Deltaproteobacteria bacterium]|nr:CCA tRNA nucleotidyltransferase [Deltaproteobacteria bacterium]
MTKSRAATPTTVPTNCELGARLFQSVERPTFRRIQTIGRLADELGGEAYLVGGCVRDLLLGRTVLDLDVVMEGDALALVERAREKLGAKARVYAAFQTATLSFPDHHKIDIATARRESYAASGHLPKVEPAPLPEDLRRRDFTVNAMALRLKPRHLGELVDEVGGMDDLRRGVIRILHDASFEDDPTRILRAIRYKARLGFSPDSRTRALMREAIRDHYLERVSGHRLMTELRRTLDEDDPMPALNLMIRRGVHRAYHADLAVAKPTPTQARRMHDAIAWWTGEGAALSRKSAPKGDDETFHRWECWWYLLLSNFDHLCADQLMARLEISAKHSRRAHERLAEMHQAQLELRYSCRRTGSNIHAHLEHLPVEAALALMAKTSSPGLVHAVQTHLTTLRHLRIAIKGQQLIQQGVLKGPEIGKRMREILKQKRDQSYSE